MEYSSPDNGASSLRQKSHNPSHNGLELSSADASYRALFLKHPQPMWIFEQSTLDLLDVNEAAIAHYGYSREEFLKLSLKNICVEEDIARLLRHHDAAGPTEYSGRWRHRKKNGGVIEVQAIAQLLNFDGKPAVLATLTDVTEQQISELSRRQAAAIAQENLDRFREIFEQASVGVMQSRIDGRLLIVNPGLCSMLGYRPEELTRFSVWDIMHPDDIEKERQARDQILKTDDSAAHLEKRYFREDGGTVWVNASLSVTRNAAGEILSILEIAQNISPRKRAEGELLMSEERFRLACDAAHLGVFDRDLTTDELRLSRQAERMFGFAPDSPPPTFRDWMTRIHPDDAAQVREEIARAVEQNQELNSEYRVVWPDGSTRWMATIAHPIWENGQPVRNIGIFQDITERKEAEVALRRSEERFRSLATTSASIVIITAPNGSVVEEMQGWREYTGQSFAESRGSGWVEMIHSDDRPQALERWKTGVRSKQAVENNFRLWHAPAQEYHYVVARGVPVFNERGQVLEWVGTIFDIHRRRQAELSLRESEERFRRMADTAPILIWIAGPDKRCHYFNKPWFNFTGRTIEEEIGDGWLDGVHHDDRKQCISIYNEAFDARRSFEMEYRLRRHDGAYRWIYDRGEPRYAEDGTFLGYIGSCVDIHERKIATEELEYSRRLFQRIAKATPGLIYVFDVIGNKIIYVNDGVSTILGYSPEQVAEMGENILTEIIDPEFIPHMMERIAQFDNLEDGAVLSDEFRVRHVDGSYRWLSASGVTFTRNEEGKVLQFLGAAFDITAQKEAAEKLEQSTHELQHAEERYRSFIQQSTEGIWRFEASEPIPVDLPDDEQIERFYQVLTMAECNDAMARMYGYRKGEELIGARLEAFLPREEPQNIEYFKRIIQNDYRVEDEESVERDRGGNTRYFSNSLIGILEKGTLARVWGIQRDVTTQRLAEAALRESDIQLRIALDAANMGTWVWEIDEDRSHWNEMHYRLLGLPPDEPAASQTLERCTHPDDRPYVRHLVDQALHGSGELEGEWRTVWPDRSTHWLAALGRVIERHEPEQPGLIGKPKRMSGVIYDITARKAAESELDQVHEQLRRLTQELQQRVEERTQQLSQANEQLQDEVEERRKAEEQLHQLMQRMVTLQEEERRRLSLELHDQMGQDLTALLMGLKTMPDFPNAGLSPPSPNARLQQLQNLTEELMEKVHQLAWELRPAALDNIGLPAALQICLDDWTKNSEVKADFLSRGFSRSKRLPPHIETTIYRVVQEALTNVKRHARASHVDVILERREDFVCITIEDDGKGFELKQPETPAPGRLGLLGMKERIALVGGTLKIETSPDTGTTIMARIPLLTANISQASN